jgi:CRP-like cAMP-binding protein
VRQRDHLLSHLRSNSGRFRRIPASAYREAYDASPDLRRTIHDHIELLTIELRQNVACHALHPVEKRLAWWLLECLDRSGGINPLPLTQEFLANMMGVQRTTINDKASVLQGEGLIEYKRGRIDILNPAGLERRACECRKTVQHFREQVEERRRQLTCD